MLAATGSMSSSGPITFTEGIAHNRLVLTGQDSQGAMKDPSQISSITCLLNSIAEDTLSEKGLSLTL